MKQVMEIIVGLLKDRVDIEKESAMKKQRQGYFDKGLLRVGVLYISIVIMNHE